MINETKLRDTLEPLIRFGASGTEVAKVLFAAIETGRAPPRQGPGPHREDRIIEADLTSHLVKLHDLKEDEIWFR